MNYNIVFAPAAAAERFIKSHSLNFRTYLYIAAVIALTVAKSVLDFAADQYERIPEYKIRYQLFVINAKRRVLRSAIGIASFVAYHGLDAKAEKLTTGCKALWQHKGELARAAMDKAFCLN